MSAATNRRVDVGGHDDRDAMETRIGATMQRALSRNIPGIRIPQTESDFDVGLTPKELIYSKDTARLYHYRAMQDEIYRVPLLIVMSPVAKGYILDLAKGQSFVEYFLLQGHDVFMLEWIGPRREHSGLRLENYVCDFIGDSVKKVQETTGERDITLVGYCMGGMLSTMFTALNPRAGIKNLACFTTPVNAEGMSLYKQWVDSEAFDIDRLVDELGIIPGDMVNASIQALRPLQKSAGDLNLLNNVENDAFVKAQLTFSRWAADQLAVPGEMAREMFKDFLKHNKFAKNELVLRNKTVDIGKIRVPFLHVAAEYDHIVPTDASKDLIFLVGSKDKQEIMIKGGHVSLVAGGNAIYRLWPKLDTWLRERAV
jgi:polyhydroxyalkanoate synthase